MKGMIVKENCKYYVSFTSELVCAEEDCELWGLSYPEYSRFMSMVGANVYEYEGQNGKIIHDFYFIKDFEAEFVLQKLNIFCTLKDVARNLEKYEWIITNGNSSFDKYLLVGSPLAFDEIVEVKVTQILHDLVVAFGGSDINHDYDPDKIATIRDDYIREMIINALGVNDVIYGTIEF